MPEFSNLTHTTGAVRSASALTETTFLRVGQTLEAAIDILSSLASSFETVLTELRGESLGGSLKALVGVAGRVAELGRGNSGAAAQFDRLQRVAEAIAARIAKMDKSVNIIDSFGINARIAAVDIRASQIDFTTFSSEIARTVSMTRTTLQSFSSELMTLRSRLGSACAGQLAFEARQDEAARSIPARLNATVNSIPPQHKRAARAISAARERSESVRREVCSAVMALQAGDITRQRLEHVDYALGFLTESAASLTNTRLQGLTSQAALTEDEQQAFAVATSQLQSAQLSDAAQEFERHVRQITTSLSRLATDAGALRTLAGSAYGASDQDHGTFIVELEAQVGEALALFADFGRSQAESADMMASVAAAADRLCEHLRAVQSLEADIRIMGLNTTLKCARVGPEGRALGLVAQELRACGNGFAKEASALMEDVESLAQITRTLGSKEADAAPAIAAVMQEALSTLQQVGQTLGDALSGVERDSDRVVTLLKQTATDLESHDAIGKAMREAAANLATCAPAGDLRAVLAPRGEQMLTLMAATYTMANERVIHQRLLGRSCGTASEKPAVGQPEMEDMLF